VSIPQFHPPKCEQLRKEGWLQGGLLSANTR
jgi:hypothetical protein